MMVSPKTLKSIRLINKISTILLVISIVGIIGSIVGIIYYGSKQNTIVTKIGYLKANISELSNNENRIFSIKDRLSKISEIKKIKSAEEEFSDFKRIESVVSGLDGSSFNDVTISPTKVEMALSFKGLKNMGTVLNYISAIKRYKKIVLTSLGYTASSGYLANLIFEI